MHVQLYRMLLNYVWVKALSQSEVTVEHMLKGAIRPSFEWNDLLNPLFKFFFLFSFFASMRKIDQKEKACNHQCLKLYLHSLIKAQACHWTFTKMDAH